MDALVTGGAGFIGSHLVDALLARGDRVRVLDDLSTGRRENVAGDAELDRGLGRRRGRGGPGGGRGRGRVPPRRAGRGGPFGGGSPGVERGQRRRHAERPHRSPATPGVRRVVFASSSSVYGGAEVVPTPESTPLRPRSPYANTKLAGEWYTRLFAELYPIETVALRYFNVFGPRQRPDSTYAAVIPLFAAALLAGERPTVHGDGTQSRDFTFVTDVVAANLAAAAAPADRASGQAFNVAPGAGTSLLELLDGLGALHRCRRRTRCSSTRGPGDVKISCADASAARDVLGWAPTVSRRRRPRPLRRLAPRRPDRPPRCPTARLSGSHRSPRNGQSDGAVVCSGRRLPRTSRPGAVGATVDQRPRSSATIAAASAGVGPGVSTTSGSSGAS